MGNKKTYQKGVWAERLAMCLLVFKGYKICQMRYKTHVGEVDIVARRCGVYVFCEVKYRPDYDSGLFSISSVSQKRIGRAAQMYMANVKQGQECSVRFDAIIISPPFYMKHLRNAWTL